MTESKLKTSESKTSSSLMRDINRIRKAADSQTRINILRKHQIKLLNEFLKKLLDERRITKEELRNYMPRKKDVEKKLFPEQ